MTGKGTKRINRAANDRIDLRGATSQTLSSMDHLPPFLLDVPTLNRCLWIGGGLLLLAILRLIFLTRVNTRLQDNVARVTERVRAGEEQIRDLRHNDTAWRGSLQHLHDTFRTEFTNRIVESERRCQDIVSRQWSLTRPQSATPPTNEDAPPAPLPAPDPSAPEMTEESVLSPLPAIS